MTKNNPVPIASLAHAPLPLFAIPMGIGGLGLAWREAGHVIAAPSFIGEGLLFLTAFLWVLVSLTHIVRTIKHPDALLTDLTHPVRSAFAGAITIGLMIIAGALTPYSFHWARCLWGAAVLAHLVIAAWVVRELLLSPREQSTLTPPLLIPLVGNILAPVFGVRLGFATESWMLFGVGALLWVMIQPLLLWRIITGPPLPAKIFPTLAIFVAPPAVGSIALARLTGDFGPLPVAVFGLSFFIVLVLMTMVKRFATIPFAMSWWGWTFPLAAFMVALLSATHAHKFVYGFLYAVPTLWILLGIVSLIVLKVSWATLRAAVRGHLFRPE